MYTALSLLATCVKDPLWSRAGGRWQRRHGGLSEPLRMEDLGRHIEVRFGGVARTVRLLLLLFCPFCAIGMETYRPIRWYSNRRRPSMRTCGGGQVEPARPGSRPIVESIRRVNSPGESPKRIGFTS